MPTSCFYVDASMVLLLAHYQVLCCCSHCKANPRTKSKTLVSQDRYGIVFVHGQNVMADISARSQSRSHIPSGNLVSGDPEFWPSKMIAPVGLIVIRNFTVLWLYSLNREERWPFNKDFEQSMIQVVRLYIGLKHSGKGFELGHSLAKKWIASFA